MFKIKHNYLLNLIHRESYYSNNLLKQICKVGSAIKNDQTILFFILTVIVAPRLVDSHGDHATKFCVTTSMLHRCLLY